MESIQFFHNPMSRGRIAHWMLEEVGVPYQVHLLDFTKREHKTPEYLKVNPMGKVPTIVHQGIVITEAAAICTYLADAFPKSQLSPAVDDPKRGAYLRWLFFASGCVEPAIVDKMFARPPVERTGALGYGTYTTTLDVLESALRPGPYILGDQFSAADVYIASQIGWGLMTQALELRPEFQHYMARCFERPSMKRVIEQSAAFDIQMKTKA